MLSISVNHPGGNGEKGEEQTWEVWFALLLVLQQPQAGSGDEVELSVSAEMQLSVPPHALSCPSPVSLCQRAPVPCPAPARSVFGVLGW